MRRIPRRKLIVNLLVILFVGVVVYFPGTLLPVIRVAKKLLNLPTSSESLFQDVFLFAQYTCPPCGVCGACDTSTGSCYTTPGVSCGTIRCSDGNNICCSWTDVTAICDGSGNCVGACGPPVVAGSCGQQETRACSPGQNCTCSGQQVWCDTGPNQTCNVPCNGATCGCSSARCNPLPCNTSRQGSDADFDGYDGPVSGVACDCDDSNPRINPGRASPASPLGQNLFCDCNANDGYDGINAAQGVSELSFCECLSPPGPPGTPCTEFNMQCYCLNSRDDNCNGLVDMDDPECPDPAQQRNWVISRPFRLTISLTGTRAINGDVYIIGPSGALTIAAGITLQIKKPHGLHIAPGRSVDPESLARIEFVN